MRRLALLIAVVAIVGTGVAVYMVKRPGVSSSASPLGAMSAMPNDAFRQELDKIRSAEQIEDPAQRCLAYPDPQEFHWDRTQVEQLCRKTQWQMLTWNEIRQALDQHDAHRIDAAFDAYLSQNYSDPQRHGYLTWTFWWMFQNSSSAERETTTRWIEEDPNSAYAWAARGIHYSQAAYDARGGKTAGNTSAEQFRRMHELAGLARADLKKSLEINPRLIVAYHGLLRTARLDRGGDSLDDLVKPALALDPADPWIYQDWIDNAQPQWGGSTPKMERIADDAAKHASENPWLATLRAEPLCNAADEFRCEECRRDGAKALDLYKQAGGFGPAGCFLEGAGAAAVLAEDSQTAVRYYSQAVRFIGGADWFAYRAQALRSIGENEWALRDLAKAIAGNPANTTALYSQGLVFAALQRFGDAENSYRKILTLDPDHRNAAIALSILYLTESAPLYSPEKARPLVAHLLERDPKHAQAWLLRAAINWTDHDAPAYIEAGRNYLAFVDHDDPSNKADIAEIEKRLEQVRKYQQAQQNHAR